MNKQHQKASLPALGLMAIAIVVLIFFDVVFLDRTLQPSNIVPHMGRPAEWQASSAIFPVFNSGAIASDGFADLNASAWQLEPARYWMARNFREGQSPWWNPYSASGALGPEVLVDIKFSPHTLISAWLLDASPASFDYGLISIYCMGVFFVLLTLRSIFQLEWLAVIAGAIFYLLNGFSVPNLNTHIGQPYFFSPVLLFAVLFFVQRQTIYRWILLVIAHAILLTINILTTMTLVLITVHLLGVAYWISVNATARKVLPVALLRYLGLMLSGFLAAFLLDAPLWFSIVDSFFVTDMVTDFENRAMQPPRNINNLLSVFTPRHFWWELAQPPRFMLYPDAGLEKSNGLIAYTGIAGALLAGYGVGKKGWQESLLPITCIVLVLLCYFRIFGYLDFINYLPVLRSIGNQYWGCMGAIALLFLVAFGIQNICSNNACSVPAMVVLLFQAIAFGLLYKKLGFYVGFPYSLYLWVAIFLFILSGLSVLIISREWLSSPRLAFFLVVIMLLEFLFYMNTIRPLRYNPVQEAPEFVRFLKENIGDGRVLNIGQEGVLYPEYGAMYGIKQADSQNPGLFPWYERFFDAHFGNDTFMFLALDGSSNKKRKKSSRKEYTLDEQALDVASIKYILVADVADPYLNFLRDKNYPVVYQKEGLSIFENVDYVPSISLAPASMGEKLDATRLRGRAQTVSYRNTEVIVETDTDALMMLVLSDVWHPAWKATVDDSPAEIIRVNEAFRGVSLPEGKHLVRFYYDPPALRYGVYAMVATALALLLLLVSYGWQMRISDER